MRLQPAPRPSASSSHVNHNDSRSNNTFARSPTPINPIQSNIQKENNNIPSLAIAKKTNLPSSPSNALISSHSSMTPLFYQLSIPTYQSSLLMFDALDASVTQISPTFKVLIPPQRDNVIHDMPLSSKLNGNLFSNHRLSTHMMYTQSNEGKRLKSKAHYALHQSNQSLYQSQQLSQSTLNHQLYSSFRPTPRFFSHLPSQHTLNSTSLSSSSFQHDYNIERLNVSSHRSYGPHYRLGYKSHLTRDSSLLLSAPVASSRFDDHTLNRRLRNILISPGTLMTPNNQNHPDFTTYTTPIDQRYQYTSFMFHDPMVDQKYRDSLLYRRLQLEQQEAQRQLSLFASSSDPPSPIDPLIDPNIQTFYVWNLVPSVLPALIDDNLHQLHSPASCRTLPPLMMDKSKYVKKITLMRDIDRDPDSFLDALLRRVAHILMDELVSIGRIPYHLLADEEITEFLQKDIDLIVFHGESSRAWQVRYKIVDDSIKMTQTSIPLDRQSSAQPSSISSTTPSRSIKSLHTTARPNTKIAQSITQTYVQRQRHDDEEHALEHLHVHGRIFDIDQSRPQWLILLLNRQWMTPCDEQHLVESVKAYQPPQQEQPQPHQRQEHALQQSQHYTTSSSTMRHFHFKINMLEDGWKLREWQIIRNWHIMDPEHHQKMEKMVMQEYDTHNLQSNPVQQSQWRVFMCRWIGVRPKSATSVYYDHKHDGSTSKQLYNQQSGLVAFDYRERLFVIDTIRHAHAQQKRNAHNTSSTKRAQKQTNTKRLPTMADVYQQCCAPLSSTSNIPSYSMERLEYYTSPSVAWVHMDIVEAARAFAMHVNTLWLGSSQFRRDLFVHIQDPLQPKHPLILQCSGVQQELKVKIVTLF